MSPSGTTSTGTHTQHIAIIGGGFCGILTLVNLLKIAKNPLHITLIHTEELLAKGIVYDTYSDQHVLSIGTKIPASTRTVIRSKFLFTICLEIFTENIYNLYLKTH